MIQSFAHDCSLRARRSRLPGSRSAFTLLELVLVMAVIVILTAIAIPSLESMYGGYRLTSAADMVRAAWASARSRAMNEGQAYRFSIVSGKGNFRVAPDNAQYWGGNTGDAAPGPNPPPAPGGDADATSQPPLITEDSLPKGVRFAPADSAQAGGVDLSGATTLPPGQVEPSAFTTLVTFLPDGTARENVAIAFQVRGARPMVLRMRGLTGAITLTPLGSEGK